MNQPVNPADAVRETLAAKRPVEHVIEQSPIQFSHDDMSELFGALAKAQGALVPAEMSRDNPYFETKYADLNDCLTVMRGPLADNGLSLIQLPHSGDHEVRLTTFLTHESGKHISTTWGIKAKDDSPQTAGSLLTYLRRYMANAIVGVAPAADDDDGARAEAAATQAAETAAEATARKKRVTPVQVDAILVKADELFAKDADTVLKRLCTKIFEVEDVSSIPAEHYEHALSMLDNQHKREQEEASGGPENTKSEGDAEASTEREPGSDDE